MALHDNEEKKRRGYTCKHSIVYMDGREWLEGVDWKRRKAQLEARAEGRCEKIIEVERRQVISPGVYGSICMDKWRCNDEGTEPDHIIPRAKLHDDRLGNLQLLCHFHHKQKHPEKHKIHWSRK